MSDVHAAQSGGEVVSVPFTPPAEADKTPTTASEAGRQLAAWRQKQREAKPESEAPAAPAEAAAEQPKSEAKAEDAAPPQEAPGETQESDPAELPPIEAPRSWTKDEKERFATLPRETQEYIASREQEREHATRQSQNEAAEQRKAYEAQRAQAEQARQQYEAALPLLLKQLHDTHMGEFADIKTIDDVQKLSVDDPVRYVKWNAQQQRIAAIAQQQQAAQQRQAEEFSRQWSDFARKQDELLLERAPELKDETRAAKAAANAKQVLKDHGFSDQELSDLFNGKQALSLRDYRVQLLVLDGVKYREAKSAKPAPKSVPPVQRPGVAQPKGADDAVQALKDKFERTGDLKHAAALLAARRKSA